MIEHFNPLDYVDNGVVSFTVIGITEECRVASFPVWECHEEGIRDTILTAVACITTDLGVIPRIYILPIST